MKKVLSGFAILIGILFTSCSTTDNDSKASDSSSVIYFDDERFLPKDFSYSTVELAMRDGEMALLTSFKLTNTSKNDVLEFNFIARDRDKNLSGTYSLKSPSEESRVFVIGAFKTSSNTYVFNDGTLTFTDLGNDNYKFEFNRIEVFDRTNRIIKIVKGRFEGTFQFEK